MYKPGDKVVWTVVKTAPIGTIIAGPLKSPLLNFTSDHKVYLVEFDEKVPIIYSQIQYTTNKIRFLADSVIKPYDNGYVKDNQICVHTDGGIDIKAHLVIDGCVASTAVANEHMNSITFPLDRKKYSVNNAPHGFRIKQNGT